MSVDIGGGESDNIIVHDTDNFMDLATEFATKHHLHSDVIEPLSNHIRNNVEHLYETFTPKPSPVAKRRMPITPKHNASPIRTTDDNYDSYLRHVKIPTKEEVRKQAVPFKKRPQKKNIAGVVNFYQQQYFQS